MVKMRKHLFTITALCLVLLPTSDSTSSEVSGLKWDLFHNHTRSYFGEISHFAKLAQLNKYLDGMKITGDVDKIVEWFRHFPQTLEKQIQKKLVSEFLGSNGVTTLGIQMFLESTLKKLTVSDMITSACVNDTFMLMTGLAEREPWALQVLDAFGKPGPGLTLLRLNFVGDYAQCRSASALSADGHQSFRGNYCILKANLQPAGIPLQLPVQIGSCMPDTCSVDDNTVLVSEVIGLLGLNGTLQAAPAECHTEDRDMSAATVIAIVVLAIIGLLMTLGTAFDVIIIQWPKWRAIHEKESAEARGYTDIEDENRETEPLLSNDTLIKGRDKPTGIHIQVLLAFSVYTNGSKVLDTKQPAGYLSAIHGIRFLSMCWVILGHVFVFGLGQFENLISEMPVLMGRWTFDAIANALVSVDTFFTLSGLLTAYVALNEMKKQGWKLNWPLYYFHRFWRLTPPYMLTLLTVQGLMQYMGSGALWYPVQPVDRDNCEKYWWTNLLYVNNFISAEDMCMGHTWYLSNDMQFFLVSPLMIVPFYFNGVVGVAVCMFFLLTSWIAIGVLSTLNQWPATLVTENTTGLLSDFFNDYYIKPWCRIGPYVVGILAGYCLSTRERKIRMSRAVVFLGWMAATATALATVYGLRGDISGENVSSVGTAAFYNAVARSAWGACVAWVIVACASGYGGFVNSILSWSPFVVMGRLTYVSYLIHPYLLYVYFQNQERLYYLNDTSIVVTFCGIVVLTNMVAFILMLAFESPWISLEKVFLNKKPKTQNS